MRELVGYDRYDTPAAVDWLNRIYAVLDVYANLFLPMRKLVGKQRQNGRVRKTYDQARTPFQRLIDAQALAPHVQQDLDQQRRAINPLQLHRQLEQLIAEGPAQPLAQEVAAH